MTTESTAKETFEAFRAALERGDIDAAIDLYADDAELTHYSERSRPSSTEPVQGKAAAAEIWRPVKEHRLKQTVTDELVGDERFAYTLICTYPSGEKVVGNYVCDVRDGRITRETATETWDE